MASTYSPSLRLELMATGDQSGTWGDTTNTNLGTLLEQAITGYLSVAQGDVANLTLTALNGATDQSRNMVLNLTGALTATRNVVVPTQKKVYLFRNSTTGGFALTIKTSGGTGVAVLAGQSRWVYCDGTNVIDGLTGYLTTDANGNTAINNTLSGYTTTVTAAGTTVLTVASTRQQFFTGTTTQTVTMPVASTLTLGQAWEFTNNSTGAVTINSSGANLIVALGSGLTATLTCILVSGTTAASWSLDYSALWTSTDAGATVAPVLDVFRDSASPAVNDVLGQVLFNGRDSAANKQEYADISVLIASPTSTTESGALQLSTVQSGTIAARALIGAGLYTAGATGGDKGINTINATTYYLAGNYGVITLGTATASTSGTTIDFTGIPSGVRRVTMNLAGVSTSGSSDIIIQIGDAGGIETSGYLGSGSFNTSVPSVGVFSYTAGFGWPTTGAAVFHGTVILTLVDTSTATWVAASVLGRSDSAVTLSVAGSKSLSPGPLDRIRLTTIGGADTFDAGKVNVTWE